MWIYQIDSMLQCVCSVVAHSWQQSVVRTKKWRSEPCELRLVRCYFHYVLGISGLLPYKSLEVFSPCTVLSHGSIMLPPHQPRVFARLARWQLIESLKVFVRSAFNQMHGDVSLSITKCPVTLLLTWSDGEHHFGWKSQTKSNFLTQNPTKKMRNQLKR